jgi:DNA-binding protein WhiA
VEPARSCCRVAERAGLGQAALGRARSPSIARLAARLAIRPPDAGAAAFEWATARDHCRRSYLRGIFLATGSLSLSAGRTHLEFVVPLDEAPALGERLTEIGLPASLRVRRGRGVVTWKSADSVVAFLRLVGAGGSALELESRFVTRSLHGYLNRVLNAEGANLTRSVASASRQLEQIDVVERSGALDALPPTARAVARLRREAPEATFSEMADRLGLSRARIQRAFRQLESAAAGARSAMR